MTFADIAAKIIGIERVAVLPEMKSGSCVDNPACAILDGCEDALIERELPRGFEGRRFMFGETGQRIFSIPILQRS